MPTKSDPCTVNARGSSNKIALFTAIALAVILVVQAGVCSWFAYNKQGMFQDEAYTYFLANGSYLHSVPEEGVLYEDGEPWYSWATVDTFLGVDFDKLYNNQADDNHPPLYYFFFSLVYSLMPGTVDTTPGCLLNAGFMIVGTLLLYFLARTVQASRPASLLVCALWAISPGMVNAMLLLRMYSLLAVFFLAASLVAVKALAAQRMSWSLTIALFLVTLGGFLTQYFFMIFAFALYLCAGILLLVRKRLACALKFAVASIGGIVAGVILFPPSIDHVFSSFRGQQALDRAASGDSFFSYLVQDWRLLDTGLFGGLLLALLCAFAILLAVLLLRRRASDAADRRVAAIWWPGVCAMGLAAVFYVVMMARVAPFASIRYLIAVEPVLLATVFLALYAVLVRVLSGRSTTALCIVAAIGIATTVLGYGWGIKYFDQETDEVAALADENTTMVAVWNDQVLQEALLPDAQAYEQSLYFSSPEALEGYDLSSLGDFSLYIQPAMDDTLYLEAVTAHGGLHAEYVGSTIDGYRVYDVHVDDESPSSESDS